MKRMLGVGLAVLMALPAFAQDERKTESQDEPVDAVRGALAKAIDSGGVVVKGRLDRESPFGGMGIQIGGLGGSEIEGDFTAKLGKNGVSLFTVDSEKGKLEVFQRGDRTVQRQAWAGTKQPAVGDFPREISRLLDLGTLKSYLRNLRKAKSTGAESVGERKCRVIQGVFPAGLLEDGEEEEERGPMRFKLKLFEVQSVKAKFYLDEEGGTLRKMEMSVTKGYSSAIRIGAQGQGGDEDEEKPGRPGLGGLGKLKFVTSYVFTVEKYDPKLTVEIPEGLRRFFEE